MIRRNRETAYALVRLAVGLMFLWYGIYKFRAGVGGVAEGLVKQFAGRLPAFLVSPFAHVLPFCEVIFGTLITLGLFNRVALTLAGLLMVALTMGCAVILDAPTVANNLMTTAVVAGLLALEDWNGFSVDRALKK
ncbi:MAG: DoxX family membrane protein [Acidobacteriia bacterium]|nr:DoxX family membrane protein [Terriglobia bacterium]